METKKIRKAVLAMLVAFALCGPMQAEPVTKTYVFIPDQSTVVQTGGLAGIYETHTISGMFWLTVDFDANTASFDQVDANLSESIYLPTQSLGELFEMYDLNSTEVNETAIKFEDNNPPLGGIEINITVTFMGDSLHLTGSCVEPWLDGFTYDLDAVARHWADAQVVPPNPTSADVVAITVLGEWPNSCVPDGSDLSVEGNDIYFNVFSSLGEVCAAVFTPWELTESVGRLSPGTYNVYVALDRGPFALMLQFTVAGCVYYVDAADGNDLNDGLTLETAFATIQKGIEDSNHGDTVLVYPALYSEAVNFDGKAITVQGVPTEAGVPVLEAPMDYAVSFFDEEEPNSVLKNIVIRDSFLAVFLAGASPTINNLTVVDNEFGISAYAGAEPDISNCIFYNNIDGDLFGCEARYSFFQDDVEDGLVSHWKFDEGTGTTAYDSAGDYDGAVTGGTWTSGILNGALDFDADHDYVDYGDIDEFEFGDSNYTVSSWFYANGLHTNDGDGTIVGKYSYVLGRQWLFTHNFDTGMIVFGSYPTGAQHEEELHSVNRDTNYQWVHVTGVRDGSTKLLYINGAFDNTQSTQGVLTGRSTKVFVGCRENEAKGYFFDGIIDDIRVYDRALSAEEVQQVYGYGLGPMFADPCNDDYHLLSERGRYWPEHDVWVLDDVSSPCLDGGDPAVNPSNEPMPNGGRINMGAYGGAPYASMSEWPIREDNNRDGIVNFIDVAMLANKWLQRLDWVQ